MMVMKVEFYRLWYSTTHRAGVPAMPKSSTQTEPIMKDAALWSGISGVTGSPSWDGLRALSSEASGLAESKPCSSIRRKQKY